MKKTIKVNVTKELIAKGHRCDSTQCPVALAINEKLPSATWVSVDSDDAAITLNRHHLSALLPPRARKWIDKFDAGKNIKALKPIKFQLTFK